MIIARTERLLLRAVTPDDAPFYLELVNDPQFVAHVGERHIHSLSAARSALIEGPVAMLAERGHALYLVTLADGGAPIGMCGLIKRSVLPEVDLGYALLAAYRGQGYAMEAAMATLAHARTLGLTRLMAIARPGNLASNRLLRKLGMRLIEARCLVPDDPATNVYAMDV